MNEIQVQVGCPYCDGGIAGYITREMAIDAGIEYLPMVGQSIHCTYCDGEGWTLETICEGGEREK
jgi:hypothetical protein